MADYMFFGVQHLEANTESRRGTTSFFGRRPSRSTTSAMTEQAPVIAQQPTASTAHIRIVPSIENPSRSLIFNIIDRDLEVGRIIKIGRFTDKSSIKNHISFKSKVVSRAHCEIWLNHDGKILIKDTKSSSGTFVNHIRLSPANTESRPIEIKDGTIVQLGIDYQGGFEEIYRSVKMKFQINRPVQAQPVSFSMSAFNNIRQLTSLPDPSQMTSCHKVDVEECCICLYALAPFQALFVAPCSHSYHFKCIRPLLDSYPGFQCPICRTYSDLDASVAIEADEVIEKYGLGQPSQQPTTDNIVQPLLSTTLVACDTTSYMSPSNIFNTEEQEVSEDHRSMINSEDESNIRSTRQNNNNLVEKIKMAFTSTKLVTKKQSTSDEETIDSPSSSSPPSSPRQTSLQPILSRQSTHYNQLNDILE